MDNKSISIKFEKFHNFSEEKPKELNNCIIIWGENLYAKTNVMFGSYYPEQHLFRDGLGGCLDENLVKFWAYDYEWIMRRTIK